MKLVSVEWEDSIQPASDWQWVSEYKPETIPQCVSVGYLIQDSKTQKSIAPNLAFCEDSDDVQMSGVIHIPTKAIKKTTIIGEIEFDYE